MGLECQRATYRFRRLVGKFLKCAVGSLGRLVGWRALRVELQKRSGMVPLRVWRCELLAGTAWFSGIRTFAQRKRSMAANNSC